MRWGLVPRWAKDPSIGAKMINARGETLAEKPSFRTAYRRHRCLLPADGFYEWREVAAPHAHKEPLHIGMKDGSVFGLAGLCERWLSADGDVLDSCTIVTTEANALIRALHDRMPVIIAPKDGLRALARPGRCVGRRPDRTLPCRRDGLVSGVDPRQLGEERRPDAGAPGRSRPRDAARRTAARARPGAGVAVLADSLSPRATGAQLPR